MSGHSLCWSLRVVRVLFVLALAALLSHPAVADLSAASESEAIPLYEGLATPRGTDDSPGGDDEPTYRRSPAKPKQQLPQPPPRKPAPPEEQTSGDGQAKGTSTAVSSQQPPSRALQRGTERTYHVVSRVVRTDTTFSHSGGGRLKVVILMPVPSFGEFQRVENVRYSAGTLVGGPSSPNRFLRVEAPEPPAEITLEFDVAISPLAADRIDGVKPYDTASPLYRTFTVAGGPLIQPDHPAIKAMVEEIGGTALEPLEFARRAYLYQQQRFKHLGRSHGPTLDDTLRAGGGACGELSSLYISLLRSRGIPARYNLGGILRESGEWGPHAWPDFYLEGAGWIPADPSMFMPNGGAFGKRGDGYLIMGTDGGTLSVDTGSRMREIGPVQHYSYWYAYWGGAVSGNLTYRHELTTTAVR
ncbi:transglutaminase-like domain-containing protein [Trichlorobacter ammonificans]|uniref:Transglutaminase-like domain-containing protein n=1 Tax=Trichlorobacter ammonificans TaxID=2916410 RepID=A0ABN8HFC0_9BACT|nr:transglutaminase-like domain-containing protein [Trichlorobacter ammonificans]CAH2031560.1 exported protein of unknown function [Trichlorobacter ammonificans]